MVICLERGADFHMARLMPLPLTISCFSKIQIGFTFLILVHPGSPRKRPLNVCVCMLTVGGVARGTRDDKTTSAESRKLGGYCQHSI